MGLFGGDSKSFSTTNLSEQNVQQAPSGDLDGSNLTSVVGSGNTLYVQDQGSLRVAENIVLKSLDDIAESNAVSAQTTQQAVNRGLAIAENSAQSSAENLSDQLTKYLLIGGGLYIATLFLKGGKA